MKLLNILLTFIINAWFNIILVFFRLYLILTIVIIYFPPIIFVVIILSLIWRFLIISNTIRIS